MTTQLLQISDRVRVGGKLGTVIAIESRPKATIYTIAFPEGPPRKFLSPPTVIEKVYSPEELLKSCSFDSSVKFVIEGMSELISYAIILPKYRE